VLTVSPFSLNRIVRIVEAKASGTKDTKDTKEKHGLNKNHMRGTIVSLVSFVSTFYSANGAPCFSRSAR
jgi:hypothetical protein